MRVFLLLVVSSLLLVESKKTLTPEKIAKNCKKSIKNFGKCLKKGYVPTNIEGCASTIMEMQEKKKRKCAKQEKQILALKCEIPNFCKGILS